MITIDEGLSYDDVLMRPFPSIVKSRKEVDVKVKLGKFNYNHGLINANMKTVIGPTMAKEIIRNGGLAILHRFCSVNEQIMMYKNSSPEGSKAPYSLGLSIGVTGEQVNNYYSLRDATDCKIWCVDVAHADSEDTVTMIKRLRKTLPNDSLIIAGNVATYRAASRLWDSGAHVIKVGIGGSGVCTTRIKTGHGVPMLSALIEVLEVKKKYGFDGQIIADGAIKNSGDIVKALSLSDAVMIGNLFSRCNEAPGEVKEFNGKWWKKYEGSSTYKTRNIEGVSGWVEFNGQTYDEVLNELLDGVRSGCSYAGVNNVKDLQEDPHFIKITTKGFTESQVHDIRLDQ